MTALVRYDAETPVIIPIVGGRGTTYDLQTVEGQRGAYRAIVGSDFILDNLVSQKIEVEHVVVHWIPDDREDAAEHGMRLRAVLVTPDGMRIATGSPTALRCLAEAAGIAQAPPPWNPPLRFLVKHEARKGEPGHWIWLDWLLGGDHDTR